MSESSLIRPIPPDLQSARGWTVDVNGERLEPVTELSIHHPRFGRLSYGLTPHGYDGWVFRELHGGGVALVVHVDLDAELFIVVVEQDRPNQGGRVLNIPRGFIDPDEEPRIAARRELHEETGLEIAIDRFVQLPGDPGNPNSAFFDTRGTDSGMRFFGIELGRDELPGRHWPCPAGPEQLRSGRLVPWYEVAELGDLMSGAGLARLLASRRARG